MHAIGVQKVVIVVGFLNLKNRTLVSCQGKDSCLCFGAASLLLQVMQSDLPIIIAGGGAAGFFAAITCREANPNRPVILMEKTGKYLQKVLVSGGGRCNVTHACFEPKELVQFYPRGSKALLGPFHHFQPGDTMGWFGERGVELKIEEDNRVFPFTDDSRTIHDCLVKAAVEAGVEIRVKSGIDQLVQKEGFWEIISGEESIAAHKVMLATGSSPRVWNMLQEFGLKIVPPVPSLFTFNIKDPLLQGLAGIAVPAAVTIQKAGLEEDGPLLITHWGLSAPAVLKLSAWGARWMNEQDYCFEIKVNWTAHHDKEDVLQAIDEQRTSEGKKQVYKTSLFGLPARLWVKLMERAAIPENRVWADLRKGEIEQFITTLIACPFQVNGKSTFKEEFVTCGGVDLDEINFKTMECRRFPGLYMAGEVIDIDAVTGGFNFQAAWTCGYLAGKALAV